MHDNRVYGLPELTTMKRSTRNGVDSTTSDPETRNLKLLQSLLFKFNCAPVRKEIVSFLYAVSSDYQRDKMEDLNRKELEADAKQRSRSRRSSLRLLDMDVTDPTDSIIHLVYPPHLEATDAVTITRGDMKRLEPDVYLNDSLIDLHIKLELLGLSEERRAKIHAFSCLFYSKLAEQKDKAAHEMVARWSKSFDLFDLSFLLVPVNLSLHWSLIVVYRPELLKVTGDLLYLSL